MPRIQSDSIDTEEIDKWYSEYPAILEEVTRWQHRNRHIYVCQEVNPDDAVTIVLSI